MIRTIAAVSQNGVIGIDGKLPFDYPADMKHFRTSTRGGVVIMGRKTFEGIGFPLPKRRNIVVSSTTVDVTGVETFSNIEDAIASANSGGSTAPLDVWLCGGARIYEAGMKYAQELYLTLTPDMIEDPKAIRFPWINPLLFKIDRQGALPDDTGGVLKLFVYTRI